MHKKRKSLPSLMVVALIFSMSVNVVETAAEALHVNESDYSIVLPNLEGLESVQLPGEKVSDAYGRARGALRELNLDHLQGTPISGTPFMQSIPEGALPLSPTVGDEQIVKLNPDQDKYGSQVETVVAAVGTHCVVYVDKDTEKEAENAPASPSAVHFQPTGTTPHENAQAIAYEFDNVIYPMITEKFGEPSYLDNTSEKIKLVLYDIHKDGEVQSDTYFAGYFDMINFFDAKDAPTSNADTIISIDIGTTQGYNYFQNEDGLIQFYGTIAQSFNT